MWSSRIRLVFLLPAVLWVLAFTIFPLAYSLVISFNSVENRVEVTRERVPMLDEAGQPVLSSSGEPRMRTVIERETVSEWTFQGLTNYARLFDDPQVWSAVRVTVIFVLAAVTIQLTLGMALAVLFNRKLPARSLLRSVMILPIFATPIAVGYLFFTLFYEEGGPLSFLGIPFLSNPDWALVSVILVDVWQWTPFAFLVFMAALQGVDEELVDAARIETGSEWQIFRYIILPLMQPTIIIVLLLRLAEAIKLFDIPFALTGGGPGVATQSYTFLAFRTGLRYFDLGYASAMAYVLLIVVMIIVTLFFNRLRSTYA
ncbi:MAG: carbohydrate ABC transporter permease [Inquilinaceae bacterium]